MRLDSMRLDETERQTKKLIVTVIIAVTDPDGDRTQCRYTRQDDSECPTNAKPGGNAVCGDLGGHFKIYVSIVGSKLILSYHGNGYLIAFNK